MAAAPRTGDWAPGRPDFALIALAAALTITGLVVVWSASFVIGLARFGDANYYIFRQFIWAIAGTILMVVAMRIDYRIYRRYAMPIMLITIFMLIAVLVVGVEGNGARRWIGAGDLTIQPAEFAKLTVILYVAAWLQSKGPEQVRTWEGGLIPFVIIIGLVATLIILVSILGTLTVTYLQRRGGSSSRSS